MKKMKTKEVLLTIFSLGLAFCTIGGGALFLWLMLSL